MMTASEGSAARWMDSCSGDVTRGRVDARRVNCGLQCHLELIAGAFHSFSVF